MKPEELFLNVLDELRQLIRAGDEYSAIKSSKLLRQLLIDGYPLSDQANRLIRLKIQFEIGTSVEQADIEKIPFNDRVSLYSRLHLVLPSVARNAPPGVRRIQTLNRSKFLKTSVLFAAGRFVTIQQIIEHAAHVLGGVHSGEPKDDAEKALHAIHDAVRISNTPVTLSQLFPICQIVVDSLTPLEAEIKKRMGEN